MLGPQQLGGHDDLPAASQGQKNGICNEVVDAVGPSWREFAARLSLSR